MKSKVAGIVFVVAGLYYILAEAISAAFFKDFLFNTYFFHSISELGIPNASSPLALLMNSAFIIVGLALIFGNFYEFKNYIVKNKTIFYILTLTTGIGVIIVALIHGGNPLTISYHMIGAVMAILGGNFMLIAVSRSMGEFETYQKTTLLLGIIGLMAFLVLFFSINNVNMFIFERIAVYTLIVWSFLTGIFLLKV